MLAFSNDYYGLIFRATQSVELFCAYDMIANETFCKYFIPIFKADLGLFHSYVPKQDPQIDAPALVMNGEDDKSLVWDTVEEWQNYFTSKVEFRKYPGEHYFVNDNRKKIIDDIAEFIKLNGTV